MTRNLHGNEIQLGYFIYLFYILIVIFFNACAISVTACISLQIIIFGGCAAHEQNNIAVDDIKICGPEGCGRHCFKASADMNSD